MTNSADRLSPQPNPSPPVLASSPTPLDGAAATSASFPVRRSLRPLAIRLGKWLITLVVIAAVGFAAKGSVATWREQSTANRITLADVRWVWLGVSALAYAVSLIPSSLVLRRALAALHQPIGLRLVMAAQLVGHLGKYVPGKAMVIILRASILSRGEKKVSIKLSAIAVIIETLNLIAVGATLSLLLVMVLETPVWMQWTAGLMAVGAAIGTLPAVLRFALSRRLRIGLGDSARTHHVHPHPLDWTFGDLAYAWFWCAISWVFTGISMTAVVLALVPMAADQSIISLTLISSAAVMLAFVAGFVSLLPGGAGVREMVLVTLLSPVITPGPALLAAVVARLVQLAVECLLAGGIWVAMVRPGKKFTGAAGHTNP